MFPLRDGNGMLTAECPTAHLVLLIRRLTSVLLIDAAVEQDVLPDSVERLEISLDIVRVFNATAFSSKRREGGLRLLRRQRRL